MDYQLKPPGRQCAATGRPLEPGRRCYSAVVERDGRLERLDFSEEGWSGPPHGTLGHWRFVAPEPEPKRRVDVDPEHLLRHFEQLVEDANPARESLCYVLALYLLKRRRLKLDGAHADGDAQYLQLSGTRGEGPYEVRDQQLSGAEVARLQAELDVYLRGESGMTNE